VFEDEQGLLIVDQHAMHERINYEKLKRNLADASPAKQQLLLPIVFTIPVKDAPKFEQIIEILQKAGFEIEPLSGSSFQIRSIPVVFQKIQFEKVWDDILEDLSEFGTLDSMHKLIDETLHTVACRSSIMFNDFVTPTEALELLKLSEVLAIDASCPHGRPTKFRLDYNELEKYFLR
jgi:DNA mismatch repair protein MutL